MRSHSIVAVATIILATSCALASATGLLPGQVVPFKAISAEEYNAILNLSDGKPMISEARLIGSGLKAIKGIATGIKDGALTALNMNGLEPFYSTLFKKDEKVEGYPLCVIRTNKPNGKRTSKTYVSGNDGTEEVYEYESGQTIIRPHGAAYDDQTNVDGDVSAPVVNCVVVLKPPTGGNGSGTQNRPTVSRPSYKPHYRPQYAPLYPQYPQYPPHYPSYPSYPSYPQHPPQYPSYPSYPSYPQNPPQHQPNYPSYPQNPENNQPETYPTHRPRPSTRPTYRPSTTTTVKPTTTTTTTTTQKPVDPSNPSYPSHPHHPYPQVPVYPYPILPLPVPYPQYPIYGGYPESPGYGHGGNEYENGGTGDNAPHHNFGGTGSGSSGNVDNGVVPNPDDNAPHHYFGGGKAPLYGDSLYDSDEDHNV